MTEHSFVDYRRDGTVAYVTLDRPEHSNLVTYAMMTQLVDALTDAASASVIVLAANGQDFTLGRDQSERPTGVSPAEALGRINQVNALLHEFAGVSVALVRGRAVGFGSGVAVNCDITVAATSAVFGFDEIAHGFPPLVVEAYLADYVPRKAALDLVLTGRRVGAEEALALGMVSRVVPDEQLEAAGAELVAGLVAADDRALQRAKSFLAEIGGVPPAERPAYGVTELVAWRAAGESVTSRA
ncbi:MAG: enoyl-CoA hydratase/isomerase family protein [Streptosporangiales bacterium]|nr:enoyl-CoA hydratase/isomerase family protein [Streptosporangiales bacterium]MBO0891832.1 enoyl-CoA hydratase/isomerase family protein [Acidothermales bacterium]